LKVGHNVKKGINFSMRQIAEEYTNRVWNEKDLSAIDELVHTEVVIHSLFGDFHGPSALKKVVQAWLKGFPDLYVSNDIVISENDLVSIQWKAKGTHLGEFKSLESSGKPVNYSGVSIYRIKNQKIVEYWAYLDMQHLLDQINT
jgi:predicted ester cyclase